MYTSTESIMTENENKKSVVDANVKHTINEIPSLSSLYCRAKKLVEQHACFWAKDYQAAALSVGAGDRLVMPLMRIILGFVNSKKCICFLIVAKRNMNLVFHKSRYEESWWIKFVDGFRTD